MQGADEEAVAAALVPAPDDPQPLSEEEIAEKEQLLSTGFTNWSRK
jgi:SWI/SNF-related matrix-associated actin-dependent regulator of chromatin subfamily A member 5